MKVISRTRKTVRMCLSILLILVIVSPLLTILIVSFKTNGIDLIASVNGDWTFENYRYLLSSYEPDAVNFRQGLFRSLYYALSVGVMCGCASVIFLVWASGWRPSFGVWAAYTILSLAVLPATYFIFPSLFVFRKFHGMADSQVFMIFALFLVTLPIAVWIGYSLLHGKSISLFRQLAVDGLGLAYGARLVVLSEFQTVVTIAAAAACMSWGNYIIPFALGSGDTFTVTVQVATFASHTGRDWATIATGGVFIVAPIVFLMSLIAAAFVFKNARREI